MAIYKEDFADIELTTGIIHRSFLTKMIGEGDKLANRFGIRAYRNGEPETLGGSCTGYFIRADGGTVTIGGTVNGNIAYVDLPEQCYAIEGQFALAIKVNNQGTTGTLRIVDGVVSNTSTGTIVDPGTILPTIETLIAAIEAAVATIPADYSYINEILKKYVNMNILDPSSISDASQRYESGITYTVNDTNGVVTASGTAVYDAWIHLYPVGTFDVSSGGLYYLCGCPEGGGDDTYYLYLENSNSVTQCKDTGKGVFINIAASQSLRVCFLVKAGKTVSSLSFKPQLIKVTAGGETTDSIVQMWQDGLQFQYWDSKTEKADKYYTLGSNGTISVNSSAGYIINTMFCPAGNIYYRHLSGAFTIVVDLVSKTAVTLQGGFGKSQYIHNGSITVTHPVMIFATSNNDNQPLVTNSPVFPSYYIYGKYCATRTITIGTGGDFSTLKEGIAYAVQFEDAVVDVLAGTYNLISEFGSDYFEALNSGSSELSGIQIGNGITINFSPQSKVVCNYTGSNQYARIKFSPFNMMPGTKGFTLNGLTLECSNVRYAVHDECNANAAYYRNRYIDCRMSKDNSAATGWLNPLVIGGGLGQNGHIDIIRCLFDSETIASVPSGKQVNYHNASSSGSKSFLYVSDSYFDGIYSCGLSYYGASTEITEMQVSGCSLPAEPSINQEGSASIVNVAIRKFNNVIR